MIKNNFSVICCGYNSVNWIDRCVESILNQKYKNFEIICIDAKTNDGTFEKLQKYRSSYPDNIKLFQNEKRQFQVENTLFGTLNSKEKSICITVDFDDWLKDENVFDYLNEIYQDQNIWMTYGCYEHFPYYSVQHIYHDYPDEVKISGTFRQYPKWLSSHLRTYRRELFLKIPKSNLTDSNGNYYEAAGDTVFMYPMLEMARERTKFIPKVLYVYNRTNPLSEDRVDLRKQENIAKEVRSKPINPRIELL